jgi:hypothetical protein
MTGRNPYPGATYAQAGLMSAQDHQALRQSPKIAAFAFSGGIVAVGTYMSLPGGIQTSATRGYPIRRDMRIVEGLFCKADTTQETNFQIRLDGSLLHLHVMPAALETETATFSLAVPAGSVLSILEGPASPAGCYAVLWARLDEPESDAYDAR